MTCNSDIKIAHGGANDLARHVTSKGHLDKGSVIKIPTVHGQRNARSTDRSEDEEFSMPRNGAQQ